MYEEVGTTDAEFLDDYATFLLRAGRTNDALTVLQRARRLDPLSSLISFRTSGALMNLERLEDAQIEIERGKNLDGWDSILLIIEVRVALEQGKITEAIEIAEAFYQDPIFDDDETLSEIFMSKLIDILALNNSEMAIAQVRELSKEALVPIEETILAILASLYGDVELAFDLQQDDSIGAFIWTGVHKELRQSSAFKEKIRAIGLLEYWRTTGNWADNCYPVDDDFECN